MERVIQTSGDGFWSAPIGGRAARFTGNVWGRLGAICLLGGVTVAACSDNPLDSGFPEVQIIMDSLEYGRAQLTGARVTFLIANRGPGVAYFDGCPDPINLVIEVYDAVDDEWGEHPAGRPNACQSGEMSQQVSLDVDQAYGYTLRWQEAGLYRIRVSYGDEATATTAHITDGPEYGVR